MTQLNQVSGFGVPGGDVGVKNYSVTDMAAGIWVSLDTVNTPSNTAPVGVVLPTNDTKPFGVTVTAIAAGKIGLVRWMGGGIGTASATIHIGDVVMCDSNGKLLPQTATHFQVGIAGSEAASTEPVLIYITPGGAKNA